MKAVRIGAISSEYGSTNSEVAHAYRAVDHLPVAALQPYDRNPRTHSPKQIRQLAASIEEFEFTNPILIDGNRRIVAGHGRVDAAKLLGHDLVPVICLDDLTEKQIRAYVIADNKLAENAGWGPHMLVRRMMR